MDVLEQQYQMIMSFQTMDDRFRTFAKNAIFQAEPVDSGIEEAQDMEEKSKESAVPRFPDNSQLLKVALMYCEKTRRLPKRLRWVLSDRAKMENLLSRLAGLNDFLRDMLDGHRAEMLRTQQIRTNYDIIRLNTKMDQLIEIITAGQSPIYGTTRGAFSFHDLDNLFYDTDSKACRRTQKDDLICHLVKLAQFKAVACAVQGHNLDGSVRSKIGIGTSCKSSQGRILVETNALDLHVPENILCPPGTIARRVTGWYNSLIPGQDRRRIWVEWKTTPRDPWTSTDGPEPAVLRRFEALVSLLHEGEVTAQFRAPRCLGYYQQLVTESEIRYGLVFEVPPNVHSDSSLVSLYDLIADKDRPVPSLTSRVRLMRTLIECIEKLHAVDWLHKGLRSDSIIFFIGEPEDKKAVNLSSPYLTGFDYSRPAASISMSEGPEVSLADDLYRHPNVQGFSADGAAGRGFRKRHDIYSLGLVLIEIAYWKPLESIIGVSSLRDLKVKDVVMVREVLLSQSHMESLESRVGDTIAQVARSCLEGITTLRHQDQDTNDASGAENLQRSFYEAAVRPFSTLFI